MNGVDISNYQRGLTIQQLRDAGKDFAIIKLTEGTSFVDGSAFEFYKEAYELGFPVGGYCYSHAINAQQAAEEAAFLLRNINKFPMPCGIYLDIEESEQLALSRDTLLDIIRAWCKVIDAANYTPGIYSSAGTLWAKVSPNSVPVGCLVWVAKWSSTPPDLPCDLWQSSDCGTIPGYNGPVDTDVSRSDYFRALVELGLSAHGEQESSGTCPIGGCNKDDNKMVHVIIMLQTAMYFTGYWGTPDGNNTPEFREALRKFVEEVCV